MFEWQGISEFLAVMELESFTKAAQRLNTSTAHVSRQINQLESRLNTRLFFRTTRQVSPTEDGSIFYQHCRLLADGLKEAQNALSHTNNDPKGLIKLTAPVTYGEQILMPILIEFMRQHTSIELDINLTNIPINLIDSGCDLAIRLGQLTDSSLICTKLSSRKLIVCASPAYLRVHGTPSTIADLNQFNCLVGQHQEWHFLNESATKSVRIRGNIKCNSGISLLAAAKAGLGLVQLPDYYVADEVKQGKLIRVLKQYQDVDEGIWALMPHRKLQPKRVSLLVDYLKQSLVINNKKNQ